MYKRISTMTHQIPTDAWAVLCLFCDVETVYSLLSISTSIHSLVIIQISNKNHFKQLYNSIFRTVLHEPEEGDVDFDEYSDYHNIHLAKLNPTYIAKEETISRILKCLLHLVAGKNNEYPLDAVELNAVYKWAAWSLVKAKKETIGKIELIKTILNDKRATEIFEFDFYKSQSS